MWWVDNKTIKNILLLTKSKSSFGSPECRHCRLCLRRRKCVIWHQWWWSCVRAHHFFIICFLFLCLELLRLLLSSIKKIAMQWWGEKRSCLEVTLHYLLSFRYVFCVWLSLELHYFSAFKGVLQLCIWEYMGGINSQSLIRILWKEPRKEPGKEPQKKALKDP